MLNLRLATKLAALLATATILVLLVVTDLDDHHLHTPSWRLHEETTPASVRAAVPPPYTDNITFVTNAACFDDRLIAVIVVPSHAGNLAQRALVRETAPNALLESLRLRRVFVLASLQNGTEPDRRFPSASDAALREENAEFGDTVQCSFVEGYLKLTIKNVMALRWATEFCPRARFVAKMDDDNLVNYYKVAEVLNRVAVDEEDLLMGMEWRDTSPRRNKSSKYYISYEEYAPVLLPDYMSGLFYWTSTSSARKLVEAAKRVPFFKAEDVFITGMTAKVAGVGHKDVAPLMTTDNELGCCRNATSGELFECMFMIGMNQQGDKTLIGRVSERVEYCVREGCLPAPATKIGLHCF